MRNLASCGIAHSDGTDKVCGIEKHLTDQSSTQLLRRMINETRKKEFTTDQKL